MPQTVNIVTTAADPTDGVRLGLTALPNAAAAAAGGLWILGANAAANTTLTGTAASGATPATPALTLTGGAASTTGGGVAAQAILATGGAGAASTNGAAEGVKFVGGGTNTVASDAHGLNVTGTSTGSGLAGTSGGGATGDGIKATAASTNGNGLSATGVGTGNGLKAASASGSAISAVASTSGDGITATGAGTTKHGINATGGATSSDGIRATGGGTGSGLNLQSGGGATGNGLTAKANSTNGHGIQSDGAGTGDGMQLTKGASGADLDADIQGTLDTLTTYTGNTPQTGDSFARIGAAGAGLTAIDLPDQTMNITGNITGNLSGNVTGSVGSVVGDIGGLAAGAITDVENAVWDATLASHLGAGSTGAALNTAAAAGDPWSTAVPGAYGAGTAGFILGTNLNATVSSRSTYAGGAVASVTAAVTVGTNNDKTGYALSSAGVQAIWDALTSALTAVGSIGKWIVDKLDVAVSTRGTFSGGAVDSVTGDIGGNLTGNVIGNVDGSVGSVVAGVIVETNNDKTGYSLIQIFPPNFALLSINGAGRVDMGLISGSMSAADNLKHSTEAIGRGTVDTGSSTTVLKTASLTPSITDTNQYLGRIVIFDADTLTLGLRGQATNITGAAVDGTLTVVALSDPPAPGDTFSIL